MGLTVGIDVGGTFTDFALMDGATGELRLGKVLTSADDPSRAVLSGLTALLDSAGLDARDLVHAVHATTIATNTVIQRRGEATALLTTAGFRDLLLIGRQRRFELYDNSIGKPRPIVPRELCFEVGGRLMWDGSERTPLDEDAVRAAAREMRARGAVSVAVCFIHSYVNPVHERRARELIAEAAPELLVSLSSEISPVYREYERASTTALNAYVMPAVSAYIGRIEDGLAELGRRRTLYIMQSNGGIASGDYVRRHPIRIIESGPAAGVLTAARYGDAAGTDNLISFDMGGTTAKVCLIEKGRPGMTEIFEVDMINLKPNSGIPMNIPAIDLVEIGAGGGSIASLEMGAIKVGPISAGSAPGPICYGLGGKRPTVTDANLVLGYLNADYFLGGEMKLDVAGARAGLAEQIAAPLGVPLEEAAWGVYEVVTAQMAQAARAVSIGKGRDPRQFALVPFGGAGPLHGAQLARQLGCKRVVFPKGAGVETAIGLLMADPAFDVARTSILPLAPEALPKVNAILADLTADTMRELDACGLDGDRRLVPSCDMRFVGQGYELTVQLPPGPYTAADIPRIRQAFLAAYSAAYGERAFDPKAAIEGVLWRLSASIKTAGLTMRDLPAGETDARRALKGRRPAYFREWGRADACDVYDRYRLGAGCEFAGPAIIEEKESTIVLPPGTRARVDRKGNLIVDL
ncbi:MAG: hydantoinase/oxoprolinase family protein [Alphaproteobacteria bacterium]|nr:hydantoinase/oxoprolinase family protein [Alphaproteobacteria bacterium]